jgi:pimeloyl-ACP methyl ester carboxylesterase
MEELRLEANGLSFRCLAAGPDSAPLVLLLHGFPEGAEAWGPQLVALAGAGWRAVAPDLRGYGDSDCPEGEEAYRMSELMADVEALMGALGAARCHLAGHDWGALIGWSLASRRPDLIRSWSALSVGHPTAFLGAMRDDEDQRQRSRYIGLFRQPGKAEEVLQADNYARLRAMYRLGADPGDAIPGDLVHRYVAGFSRPGRLTAALNYYRANLSEQAPPLADGRLDLPSQLIWGDQDPAVGRLGTDRTAAFVAADYRLTVLPGAGHWLQLERPREVSSLLLDWIGSH